METRKRNFARFQRLVANPGKVTRMAAKSTARLLLIVTGSTLRAEEVDRPLAYYLKQRVEANLKYKSFSENEIRQTELEVQKSKASLAKAREDKEILGLTLETKTAQLAQYQVSAPFDGLVTKIHRWPGQSVRPGDPVITITDMSLLRAVLKVDYKRREEVFARHVRHHVARNDRETHQAQCAHDRHRERWG